MEDAIQKFWPEFITPMAAVAGSVADEVMAAICADADLDKAYVNNGGDIAIHLAPGNEMRAAIAGTGHAFADRLAIRAADPVRGIATSGWRGRSFSLGIADAVTVLAKDAAAADAAATLIANAVDLPGHSAITRQPANELSPDSDLGERLVTTGVGALSPAEVDEALDRGAATAEGYRRRGLIVAAALFLNRESRPCGNVASASDVITEVQRPRHRRTFDKSAGTSPVQLETRATPCLNFQFERSPYWSRRYSTKADRWRPFLAVARQRWRW